MELNQDDYDINMNVFTKLMGMPGEAMQSYLMAEGAPEGAPDITSGVYKVTIILGRPNHLPQRSQYEGFVGQLDGDSFVRLAKPKASRRPRDLHTMTLQFGKGKVRLLPNDEGFAGRFEFDPFNAASYSAAEEFAVALIAPLLSGWATFLDTPLFIDQVRIEDEVKKRTYVRTTADQWEVSLGPAGSFPRRNDEYTHYATLYRDAICQNSPIYRFLSLYKLVEALGYRQKRLQQEGQNSGVAVADNVGHYQERFPSRREELAPFLKAAYPIPWLSKFDPVFEQQVWVEEVAGRKFNYVISQILRPARDKIAHSLMDDGELGLSTHHVNQEKWIRHWTPLLRCMARIRLRNSFPDQFIYQPKQPLLLPASV